MKEWNKLLEIIDTFIYDNATERIIFNSFAQPMIAKEIYDAMVNEYGIGRDENTLWAFDIALDCVRNMKDSDRDYLKESYNIHFHGYGMYIRNRYIHCATIHKAYLSADHQCSIVLEFIYTILHRYYNMFNTELCSLLNSSNYQDICRLYSSRFPLIEEETLQLTKPDNKKSYKDVLKIIKYRLRAELGRNEFKNILLKVVKECGKEYKTQQEWLNFVNKLYGYSPLYIREYHQVLALKEVGLIRELVYYKDTSGINSIADCKAYIDDEIGFREEDAQLLAEAMWEAYH